MDREDIIKLAREAGMEQDGDNFFSPSHEEIDVHITDLERFAAIVAAAEREKVAAWMIQRGYATGHGDTTEDLLKELDWQVLANWSSAMKTGAENEREACAKVCEDDFGNGALNLADAIRARGETK